MRFGSRHLSLRQRILFALVGFVAVFVSVQGVLAYLSLSEQEDDLADEWVRAEARRLASRAEIGDLRGARGAELLQPTPTLSAWFIDSSGESLPAAVPAYLAELGDGLHRPKRADSELHVAVATTPEGRLFVQYDAKHNEDKVDQFGVYLIGLGGLCIVIALAASRWIAGVVASPIERLSEQLSNFAPGASIRQPGPFDEEDRLFDAFQRVQDRFEEAVAREREFISNVRHELRTPLTALRTDLELLSIAERDDSGKRSRLKRALSTVDTLNAAIESARALSQRQSMQAQVIDLAQCVDDARASLSGHAGMERLNVINAVASGTMVDADRHSLLTILRNLIRNAAEHAAPAECVVSYSNQCVEVCDDGPGIAAGEIPFIFERYYRGRLKDSPGVTPQDQGLGLAIARQIADLNGWSLTAEPGLERGVRFRLLLG